jgi:hypothetical protein
VKKLAPLIDLLCLGIFVTIGRANHHDGLSVGGVVSTLWPFALGLAMGWSLTWRYRRSGEAPREGLLLAVVTVAAGMVARVVSGQGTVLAFIIVALAFVTLFFVGWRLVARVLRRT